MTGTALTLADVIRGAEPDYEALLVYSDYLEDKGDVEGAESVRWICRHRKWPYRMEDDDEWWYWLGDGTEGNALPPWIFTEDEVQLNTYWGDATGRESRGLPPVKTVQWLIDRCRLRIREGFTLPEAIS